MSQRAIAKLSGGEGSWLAADAYQRRTGQQVEILFTDTLIEDQDTYRFLICGAAKLLGLTLPAGFVPEIAEFPAWEDRPLYKAFVMTLAAKVRRTLPGFHWIADGRDPFDIFEHERFLGNSSADPCSKILKRRLSDRWLRDNCDPTQTTILVGIDHEEIERFEGDDRFGRRGLRRQMADAGWTFKAPLIEPPWLSPTDRRARIAEAGLWRQRLSAIGFSHSNCGGFCCKGGQGHFKLMLQSFPERYAYVERREQEIRAILGDVSMMTDRRGGSKKPLTLETLRDRVLTAEEAAEMCRCACLFGGAV